VERRKLKQINDVDTTKTITHIGLCAGYGGIELGLARVLPTLRSVALCEIEAFPIANLVAKMEAGLMEPAPIWTDLKTFPWESFRDRVDILTGGYPCQPFSAAGKRAGKEDPRHLWPWIADGIRILRPKVCFFENVEGHISLGLREVIGELEEIGYQTAWGIFSAREVGAPHQRKRVFILAHDRSKRLEGVWECCSTEGREAQTGYAGSGCNVWPSRPGEPQHGWEPSRVVGNTKKLFSDGCNNITGSGGEHRETLPKQSGNTDGDKSGSGSGSQTESQMGGNPDGPADWMDYAELYTTCDNRTDELRLLGNGVVPATAERAFRTLFRELI
jgi:DNA (cytosine-5)-methyltransferase 1